MTGRLLVAGIAALMFGLVGAGCGSDDNGSSSTPATEAAQSEGGSAESEAEKEKESESEGERTECKKPATSDPTGLPSGFPTPSEVTVTEARKDGPSAVVEGYFAADLDAAYSGYEAEVKKAGYKILFQEKEEHDAEISYSGGSRTGQIALRDTCSEPETTRVHITNRPG